MRGGTLSGSAGSRFPRSAWVLTLLVLAVLATGGLSWEAIRSARVARAAAEGVLKEYAAFAAEQFVRSSVAELDERIASAFVGLRHQVQKHQPRDEGVGACDCPPLPGVLTSFAWSRDGFVHLDGVPLPEPVAGRIARAFDRPRGPATLEALNDGRVLVTTREDRHGEPVLMGVVASEGLLQAIFDEVTRQASLLPRTLVDPERARGVLEIQVRDVNGVRYRAGHVASTYQGVATFPPRLGGFDVTASISPEAASALVIGGLPRDRWPVVAALLGLALVLVAAAVVQLRREIRFARDRADFVSSVSHELRTPLAQIRLYGETLMLGRVRSTAESRRAAEVIVQESRRLSQMVDNVLMFSRASHGPAPVRRRPTDVGALVADVVHAFRPQAASKGMVVDIDIDPDGAAGPRAVDPDALRQILLNFLDNALKYGPRGQQITVHVAGDDTRLRLGVADQGAGIGADVAGRIWEPFWRGSSSVEGGTGLGLAIVRTLAEAHGGAVSVSNRPEGGARFGVDIDAPIAAPSTLAVPERPASTPHPA